MNALQNVVDYGVIGLLLALSVWTVAIAVEQETVVRVYQCQIVKKPVNALVRLV